MDPENIDWWACSLTKLEQISYIVGGVKEWQTLIGAGIALLAALITVAVMSRQINVEKRRHEEIRVGQYRVARAHLPDALNGIMGYLKESMERSILSSDLTTIEPPGEAMDVVKALTEYEPEFSNLVFDYQIHNARRNTPNFDKAIFMHDTAKLHAYVSRLFPFARAQIDDVPTGDLTANEIKSSLKVCHDLMVIPSPAVADIGRAQSMIEDRYGPAN
ncbi:MAG TPA: hypothetical protein EYQ81_05505 [Sneathiellales bacterium]|nr:hypothetical protein [Sneathiellales bacterium]